MDFDLFRIGIVVVFLALLFGILLVVRRFNPNIKAQLHKNRRIVIQETTLISPQTRAVIIRVDEKEFVTLVGKSGATALTALSAAQECPSCGS